MKKPTQKQRVIKRLKERGKITRNECLNTFPRITRLSAIIQDLEKEGWYFEARDEGKDYSYRVKISPLKKVVALKTKEGTVRLLETSLFN